MKCPRKPADAPCPPFCWLFVLPGSMVCCGPCVFLCVPTVWWLCAVFYCCLSCLPEALWFYPLEILSCNCPFSFFVCVCVSVYMSMWNKKNKRKAHLAPCLHMLFSLCFKLGFQIWCYVTGEGSSFCKALTVFIVEHVCVALIYQNCPDRGGLKKKRLEGTLLSVGEAGLCHLTIRIN